MNTNNSFKELLKNFSENFSMNFDSIKEKELCGITFTEELISKIQKELPFHLAYSLITKSQSHYFAHEYPNLYSGSESRSFESYEDSQFTYQPFSKEKVKIFVAYEYSSDLHRRYQNYIKCKLVLKDVDNNKEISKQERVKTLKEIFVDFDEVLENIEEYNQISKQALFDSFQ